MSAIAESQSGVGTRHAQWSLALMLLALHASLGWGVGDWWARAFLLSHFGLFLLWQPVWRGERDVESRYAFLVVVVGFLLAAWVNWWLMAVWLGVLFGLIGGAVPGITQRRQRIAAMLAALYLLSMLLLWVVPHLFPDQEVEDAQALAVRYVLPLIPVAILLVRMEPARAAAPVAVDLFYSVILFLLVSALVLGSFVVKQLAHGSYPLALAQTLFGIALVLMTLSWLWNPRGGFSGLGHLLSRYLMSLGLPFEQWVQRLAELAEQELHPQRFLALGVRHVMELPWVTGVEWQARHGEGEHGAKSEHSAEFWFQDLRLKIHTRWTLSPAMLLHLKLLTQMIGHFYDAKRREQVQRQSAYVQAIYETGARLTHDVKNLLQSMRSLCSAVETSGPDEARGLQTLLQRQLPQITQRLNATLEKLRSPQPADAEHVDAAVWWNGLLQRYSGRNIQFQIDGAARDAKLPAELFDGVADNLIENALNKSSGQRPVRVQVIFSSAQGSTLTVCDDGAAIAGETAQQLFDGPVPSHTGLGVALYQTARQAQQLGYRLALAVNEPGRVCFVLARESDPS